MQPHRTPTDDIAAYTEAGDLQGWCDEHEARSLISRHLATVQCERRGRRRIVMVADESAPLRGAAKQRAIAGYVGAPKFTYREELVIGKLVMLKRYNEATGQFVVWPTGGPERLPWGS